MTREHSDSERGARLWLRVAEVLFFAGVGVQGWGLYATLGPQTAAIVLGSEAALVGLIGVLRSAR